MKNNKHTSVPGKSIFTFPHSQISAFAAIFTFASASTFPHLQIFTFISVSKFAGISTFSHFHTSTFH